MGFPKTLNELKAAAYKFSNDANCKGCVDEIEWWQTPTGRKLPMNPMSTETSPAVTHWATCSDAPLLMRGDERKRDRTDEISGIPRAGSQPTNMT